MYLRVRGGLSSSERVLHVVTRQGRGGLSSLERPSSERNKKKSFTLNFKMTEVSGLVRQGLEASMLTYFAGIGVL